MPQTLMLPDRLDLSYAEELLTALRAFPNDAPLELNAQNVTHFSGICLQSVICKARRLKASGAGLTIANLSERVTAQLSALGTSAHSISEDTYDS